MLQRTAPQETEQGFTLIELSIVLVVIGLIIGAVLVGRDMIWAAEIRKTISQVEKFNAAANTFRTKYNGLPGDLPAATANSFGLSVRNGVLGTGDGDGLILAGGGGFAGIVSFLCGETVGFWNDLSTAQLIDGKYVGKNTFSNTSSCPAGGNIKPDTLIPKLSRGNQNFLIIYSDGGLNYYQSLQEPYWVQEDDGDYNAVAPAGFSSIDGYAIDSKIDDGMPLTGTVRAFAGPPTYGSTTTAVPAVPGAGIGVCISNTAGNPYNLLGGETPACSLRFKANF